MQDCTLVVALDQEHLEEWKITWPTWVKFHPIITQMPLLVICDATQLPEKEWQKRLEFLGQEYYYCGFEGQFDSQREKMVSSFVLKAPFEIDTCWYLKLDTDAIAISQASWPKTEWFDLDAQGRIPSFISSPWPYSKPADVLDRLDDWGDKVPGLLEFPRLNVPRDPQSGIVRKPRVISWCYFGHTGWTRQMARLAGDKLPVPSQDTYLWYCAERRGDFYRTVKMAHHGWKHLLGKSRLLDERNRLLLGEQGCEQKVSST